MASRRPLAPPFRLAATLLCLPLVALALGACGGSAPLVESASTDPTGAPRVDGDLGDWERALTSVEGEPFTFGVRNDGDALYLAFVSSDRDVIRHVLLTGLVVWLDPEGGGDEALGVHFPLGLVRDGRLPDLAALRDDGRSDADRAERLEALLGELALVRDGERTAYARGGVPGLEADASLATGVLVVELRVPLRTEPGARPFALAAAPGATVGVGFETPELDRDALRAQVRARMQAQGGGRRGGGMRGAGRRGGDRPSPPEPVEAWVRVALAD
jgi:hypothetical protein